MTYLDNAATSWPKPPEVAAAMAAFLTDVGANPGRSAHRRSLDSARIVEDAREAVADLVNAPNPLSVIFTANATEALNLALCGLLAPGDHVVTTGMEHNAVMRPLRALEADGVALTQVACGPDGTLLPSDVEAAITPRTRLIVATHASNVTGTLMPIADLGRIARAHGVLLLVDAAQTAGAYPIDVQADAIDLLAFTGHKALLGPMGTGGLVIGERVDVAAMRPLKRGGTGSRSESEEQPTFLPDKFEAGTPNVVGLAGLAAGVRWVLSRGVEQIRAHEQVLTATLLDSLHGIPGVRIVGPDDPARQVACVSFTLDGVVASDAAFEFDDRFDLACRVGLHCAPSAHRTLGTAPHGTIRFSLGALSTLDDVTAACEAVATIAREAR